MNNINWMRVIEASPNKDIEVLVYDSSVAQVTTGHFDGKRWETYSKQIGEEITHWAFLPIGPTM